MTDREIDVLVAGRVFATWCSPVCTLLRPVQRSTPTGSRSHQAARPTERSRPHGWAHTPRWSPNWVTIPSGASSRKVCTMSPTSTYVSPSSTRNTRFRSPWRSPMGTSGRSSPTNTPATYRLALRPRCALPTSAWPRPRSRQAARLRAKGTTIVGGVGWDPSGQWSETLLDQLEGVDVLIVNDMKRSSTPERTPQTLHSTSWPGWSTGRHHPRPRRRAGRAGTRPAAGPRDRRGRGRPHRRRGRVRRGVHGRHRMAVGAAERLRLASVCATCSVRGAGGARSAPHPADIADLLADHHADPGWASVRQWAEQHRHSPVPATPGALTP